MQLLKELAYMQGCLVDACNAMGVDYSIYRLTLFVHKGICISNPFLDESGMYEVDPIEYYGSSYLNSEWRKFL